MRSSSPFAQWFGRCLQLDHSGDPSFRLKYILYFYTPELQSVVGPKGANEPVQMKQSERKNGFNVLYVQSFKPPKDNAYVQKF